MRVRVLFFGQLKEITGLDQEDAELSEGARVQDLFERYGRRFPRLASFRASIVASVNQEYATWRAPLASGDEVAFLPPVSGGQQVAVDEDIFQIVWDAIRPQEIIANLKRPEDGALVVFDGFVRNNLKGKRTLYLEYQAYETMALAKMREIGTEIRAKFSIHRLAMVHRLGRLESARPACSLRLARRTVVRHSTLAATVSILSSESFPSGRRSISSGEPSGPKVSCRPRKPFPVQTNLPLR